MTTHTHRTVQLGELVAVVFDEAARYSTDPREVSQLATRAVAHLMRRGKAPSRTARPLASRKLPG